MFCSHCGREIEKSAQFCANCGRPTVPSAPTEPPRRSIPIPQSPYGPSGPLDGKAVASLICGVLFFVPLLPIAAVVLGHLSLSEIRKSGQRLSGHGMAVAGLVLGYGGTLFTLIAIGIVAMIPIVTRPQVAANEEAAIQSMRRIDQAAHAYGEVCPGGFPETLRDLGPGALARAKCPQFTGFVDPALSRGFRQGYVFSYVPQMNHNTGKRDGYVAGADPAQRLTGRRHFFIDQTGVVRFEPSRAATKFSTPVK